MKAIVCRTFGPPGDLKLEDVPEPKLGATGLRVEVHSAGLNFPDVLIVQGKYQVRTFAHGPCAVSNTEGSVSATSD